MKRPGLMKRLTGGLAASLHTRGLILWAAALATGVISVWEHVHSTELAAQIESLRSQREDLLAEIGFLKMECTRLSSRERIEVEAAERLDLRYPSDGEVVWLVPGGARTRGWTDDEYVEGTGRDRIDG